MLVHGGEQAIVGRRVEQLGAGIYLDTDAAGAPRLREAVRRLLSTDTFRRRAGAVRESFLGCGGVTRAADAIALFAAGVSPQPSGVTPTSAAGTR